MATLNLFPARVQFVDPQGRLTPESYRALQLLYDRVGGSFGDQGTDVFADVMGSFQSDQLPVNNESVIQPNADGSFYSEIVSQPSDDAFASEMIFAGETSGAPIQAVTPGASPYTYTAPQYGTLAVSGGTVTAITLTRAGITAAIGILAGLVPVATGDKVTITYTVAPTINFIPR